MSDRFALTLPSPIAHGFELINGLAAEKMDLEKPPGPGTAAVENSRRDAHALRPSQTEAALRGIAMFAEDRLN